MTRPTRKLLRTLLAALATVGVLVVAGSLEGCSSAPKAPEGLYEERNRAAALAKLGDGFMAKAQYADALKYYEDALKLDSSLDDLPGVSASRASMGRAYLASGEMDAARQEFQTALEYGRYALSSRAQSVAMAGLGEIAFASGAKEEALADFEEALALAGRPLAAGAAGTGAAGVAADDKPLAVALHDRAVVKAALGRAPEAIADFEKAQALNAKARRWAELGANRYALASALAGQGKTEAALAAALGALDADKRGENARAVPLDLAAAASLSQRLGKGAEAWDYWRRCFDSGLSADDAASVRKALTALVAAAPALGKPKEGERYATLLAQLDEAQGR